MTQRQPLGPPRLVWQKAAVEAVTPETYRVKTFTLRPQEWRPFRPGQHFDVRLTAPDGYQAQRSYSIASEPERTGTFDLTVELVDGGEVSPFFFNVVQMGDEIEVRGPIGGPFTWTVLDGGPVLLIAGGSGIVPIMSMLRHRTAMMVKQGGAPPPPALLLYSSRSSEDIIYRGELDLMASGDGSFQLFNTLTRHQPSGWKDYARRLDRHMVADCIGRLGTPRLTFICGPTGFVEAAAEAAVEAGAAPASVRTERFGPSGS
ncbi:MAG: oxidoreductase [Dehalococcoidia bacterium]|nr:oxidoreductase [Dehalococcoidia bacterium]